MYSSLLLAAVSTILFPITIHLFQQTVLLNPSINSFDSFALPSADKVTIGTWSFASVILKIALLALAAVGRTQFSIQFNESSIFYN